METIISTLVAFRARVPGERSAFYRQGGQGASLGLRFTPLAAVARGHRVAKLTLLLPLLFSLGTVASSSNANVSGPTRP